MSWKWQGKAHWKSQNRFSKHLNQLYLIGNKKQQPFNWMQKSEPHIKVVPKTFQKHNFSTNLSKRYRGNMRWLNSFQETWKTLTEYKILYTFLSYNIIISFFHLFFLDHFIILKEWFFISLVKKNPILKFASNNMLHFFLNISRRMPCQV